MTRRRLWTLVGLFACGSALGANACGSSGDDVFTGDGMRDGGSGGTLGPSGIACGADGDCSSPWPYCDTTGGQCVECVTDTACGRGTCDPATYSCVGGSGTTSSGGSGTTSVGDASTSTGDPSTALFGGPRFPGAGGFAGIPLQPGLGPDTADACPSAPSSSTSATQVRDSATLCFYGDDPTPAATIEQVIEVQDGVEYVHIRVTFDPNFADNTYGAGSIGWDGAKGGTHTFDQLVGSDHLELLLTNCAAETVMDFNVDYISQNPDAPSGYGTLGVTGGDGKMTTGDASDVLAVATSIDRNLDGCGYGDYVVDSPATDETYAPNPDAPNWDYRVVYEVWVDAAAFDGCFGQAYIESVHASPSKGASNTIEVQGGPCPPDWETPYCTSASEAGCGSTPTDAGSPCPQNTTPYPNCPSECVPIPYAGYADHAACPDGWTIDLASEGRYCVPEGTDVCQ